MDWARRRSLLFFLTARRIGPHRILQPILPGWFPSRLRCNPHAYVQSCLVGRRFVGSCGGKNQTNLNSLRVIVVWRLCKPGIVAAGWQAVAILAVTICFALISSPQFLNFGIGSIARNPNAFILSWCYFLTGLGVALTDSQLVSSGATDIHRASRLMHPREPKRAVTILFAQLCTVAIVLGMLSLMQALEVTLHAEKPAELSWKGLMALPSIYSTLLAAFGNMARAAYKALG
jgi:hypothetical protein